MGNSPVDRDKDYMYQMWGTNSLITDYWCKPHKTSDCAEEYCIQEVMHDNAKIKKENLLEEWYK